MKCFAITILNRKRNIKVEYIATEFSYRHNGLTILSDSQSVLFVELESDDELIISEIRGTNER